MKTCLFKLQTGCYSRFISKAVGWIQNHPTAIGKGLGPASAFLAVCLLYCAAHGHAPSYRKNGLTGIGKAKATRPTDVSTAGKRTFVSLNSETFCSLKNALILRGSCSFLYDGPQLKNHRARKGLKSNKTFCLTKTCVLINGLSIITIYYCWH